MFIVSGWILPLYIMKCPSVSLFMTFVLKSILSDISIATEAFFPLSICLEYFFQPFTFSLCRSFFMRWISCRQHMFRPCFFFFFHSATLCLFIGAFNPLIFKVIIDSYFIYFPPFFPHVPLSLTIFLPLLIVVPLHVLQCWFGGGVFFEASFVWETPYFAFHFNEEPSWVEKSWLQAFAFHCLEYLLPFSHGLECFCWEICC